MKNKYQKILTSLVAGTLLGSASAYAGANPSIGWNYNTIVATPHYPIVGEEAKIEVVVTNPGDAPASNVQVKISFNDWGVTFQGWQEIDTVTVPSIPAGGSVTVETFHVFETRTHTCLEALIVGAVENTDINDDRGQINLEVINTGETFSWNVPVVNNGDQPLHLLVVGMCKPGDPAGTANGAAPCREDAKEVNLAPGEEMLVPVHIDLHGFAVGQHIEFEVNAYDLGAGTGAFLPQNRNHVLIRIVKHTARSLKQAAHAQIMNVAGNVDGGLKKRVEAAATAVAHALNNGSWVDDNHLQKAGGAAVFGHDESAVNQLMSLLDTEMPLALKAKLDAAALKLSDSDRILTQGANGALQPGDDGRADGNYQAAIRAYKRAWQSAQ